MKGAHGMRGFFYSVIGISLMLLVGCGGKEAQPPPVSLTPAAPQVLEEGTALTITAAVSSDPNKTGVIWSLNPAVGSLDFQTTTSVTYQAPTMVTNNFIVTITATAIADSSKSAPLVVMVVAPGKQNVQPITVNGGPDPTQPQINVPYTSVLICVPGTSNCQTVDNILVDTGSVGLRILKSQLHAPLQPVTLSGGGLNACISFVNLQFLWGEVASADLYLAGEKASGISVQLIADPTEFSIPSACANGGTDADTPQVLPANGILGIGPEPTDCTFAGVNACDPNSGSGGLPPRYFVCFGKEGCALTQLPKALQISNPIVGFAADDNGEILDFPAVGTALPIVEGAMTFGINTEANNALAGATVFAMDAHNQFTTIFANQQLTSSFIDSGSPEFAFPNVPGIALCPDGGFYCPASSPVLLSVLNQGAANVGTGTINFQVDNHDADIQNNPANAVFGFLAASDGVPPCQDGNGSCTFDWGLPFFYNRRVFTSIDLQTVANAPKTPWWAY
jgi:hypothetical protein